MATNLNPIIPINIGEFTIGRVVKRKHHDEYSQHIFGHVLGFSVNSLNELVIEVKWASNIEWYPHRADSIRSFIHPGNIELL
jgi:hypothetical protein